PDDQQARARVAEARDRTTPVGLIAKRPALLPRDGPAVLAQPRAELAGVDAPRQLIERRARLAGRRGRRPSGRGRSARAHLAPSQVSLRVVTPPLSRART